MACHCHYCCPADFEKPFDSPAILVVGHQTDGKSALVEALMGKRLPTPAAAN
jgi:hypothetical protein